MPLRHGDSPLVNADIDEIIHHGEERTAEINSKYEGLTIDDLNNFKSELSVKEWEGVGGRGLWRKGMSSRA